MPQSECLLDHPVAAFIAMAFVGELDEDRDEFIIGKEQQRIFISAVRSHS